jgi:hypothetical protein
VSIDRGRDTPLGTCRGTHVGVRACCRCRSSIPSHPPDSSPCCCESKEALLQDGVALVPHRSETEASFRQILPILPSPHL